MQREKDEKGQISVHNCKAAEEHAGGEQENPGFGRSGNRTIWIMAFIEKAE